MSNFKENVLSVVRKIKKGKIMTYKSVAERVSSPRAARAVGSIMRGNYDLSVPCHRVIKSDGTIGDYNRGGKQKKIEILKSEGVKFRGERVLI